MNDNGVVIMPDDTQARLEGVDSEPGMVKKFYPKIAQKSGVELNAWGIALMMKLAIFDLMKEEGYPLPVEAVLRLRAPSFIKAIVDDVSIATEAIEIFNGS